MTHIRPLRAAHVLLLAPLLLAACGGNQAPDPFDTGSRTLAVEVDNQNFQDATLYAVASGLRHRLGTVTGKSQGRFTMDWDFSRPLQIRIDLLAAGSCFTQPLLVEPGETVQLIVSANLDSDPDCR